MSSGLKLMVFTDLDGTLIDHESYQWAEAMPALTALNAVGAGIVLASSKTGFEIESYRADLALSKWPAIVENGAGVLAAFEAPSQDSSEYITLRMALNNIPAGLRRSFVGFGDWSASEVARQAGLSLIQASLAKKRAFSEPGLWRGTTSGLATFKAQLNEQGIDCREGGRYLTLSFGGNKSNQMAAINTQFQPQHTVALGDAPNDIEMLEAADFGVIVHNPHREPLPILNGEAAGHIVRTKQTGPLGWNAAILDLLRKLELKRG
ncbi:MAG: HAD-IIB family hydrolase [Sedimentitalea sp.]